MTKISLEEWLKEDFESLKNEYLNEDKTKYENLFSQYFISKDVENKYNFTSSTEIFNGIEVMIIVSSYLKIETFFYSLTDLTCYTRELRQSPKCRDFTKLCFYIMEQIKAK